MKVMTDRRFREMLLALLKDVQEYVKKNTHVEMRFGTLLRLPLSYGKLFDSIDEFVKVLYRIQKERNMGVDIKKEWHCPFCNDARYTGVNPDLVRNCVGCHRESIVKYDAKLTSMERIEVLEGEIIRHLGVSNVCLKEVRKLREELKDIVFVPFESWNAYVTEIKDAQRIRKILDVCMSSMNQDTITQIRKQLVEEKLISTEGEVI